MLNKILSLSLLLSTLLFIILVTALPVNNPDIWYHLKTGEYILNHKTIPKKDFFSFTAAGREWIAQWWFYDIVVFFLQNRFGFNSLIYLKVAIGILIFVILYKTLKFYHLPNTFTLPLLVFTAWIVGTAWVDRPHLFSYLFTVFLMWILISYQFGKKRPLFLIPPLFLIWANMHASIPIALVLTGFLIVSEGWEKISKRELTSNSSFPSPRRSASAHLRGVLRLLPLDLVGILFLGTVASLINPNTYKTHLYVFKINPEFVSQNIVEWIPLSSFFDDFHIRLFLIFGLLTLASFFYVLLRPPKSKKFRSLKISLFEIVIVASLSYLSLSALRFTPVFVLIILPFMAKNLWLMTNDFRQRRTRLWRVWLMIKKKLSRQSSLHRQNYGASASIINHQSLIIKFTLLLIILALSFFHERKFGGHHLGVELGPLPAAAVEFIDKVEPTPPMYHVFNWGGYLMWRLYPKYKVFIDGRLDMYVSDIYNEWLDVVLAKENWKEILKKYKINFCFISNEPEWNRLNQALESDPQWILIYWDNKAGIFLKNDLQNKEILEKYGMEATLFYHPTTPFKAGREKEAEEEYLKFSELYPENSAVHNKLGVLYFLTDQKEKAKEELRKAIDINPSYSTAHFNLGLVLEARGEYNEALGFYQKARNLSPAFPDTYKKLGYIYSQKLNYQEEAVWHLEKYLQLNPKAADRREVEAEIEKNTQV